MSAMVKQYPQKEEEPIFVLNEASQLYGSHNLLTDINKMIDLVREGMQFKIFDSLFELSPFTQRDWSSFLHISERTLQRYRKEKKKFEPLQSERILAIAHAQKRGHEVFGNQKKFNVWLENPSIVFGGKKPKELLDSSFGIQLFLNELGRIEHGVLA